VPGIIAEEAMSNIEEKTRNVRHRIAAAAARAGRDPSQITLCAVTKTVEVGRIREAVSAGIRDLGENYYQEARDKLGLLPPDVRWHFIGHLQTNKAKYIAGRFALVQSVDRVELAVELGKRAENAGVIQPVLIEVKLDPSETKAGIAPEDALRLCESVARVKGLRLEGLMGIPPITGIAADARPYFDRLRRLFEMLPAENCKVLSMGMTADFEVAIEEGATMVRVGTAIFGRRD
jgi:pyridoxal phosphate enzyme (YggS family)